MNHHIHFFAEERAGGTFDIGATHRRREQEFLGTTRPPIDEPRTRRKNQIVDRCLAIEHTPSRVKGSPGRDDAYHVALGETLESIERPRTDGLIALQESAVEIGQEERVHVRMLAAR